MTKTIRGHNLRATLMLLVLAVLLLVLVMVVEPAVTAFSGVKDKVVLTDDHGATGTSLTRDPYIEHHAAIVARRHDGSLR